MLQLLWQNMRELGGSITRSFSSTYLSSISNEETDKRPNGETNQDTDKISKTNFETNI
jgi:hypothetical protein